MSKTFAAPINTKHVGLIGAGAMGFALLKRLVAHDFAVSVFDRSHDACARASAAGAKCMETAQAVFALGIPTITCVASPEAFLQTVAAAISAQRTGIQLGPVIESSTLGLKVKEDARNDLQAVGVVLLDCPLSGTSAQAHKGELVVFASGDTDVLRACGVILGAIAHKVVWAGEFGMGMRLKLLANHLVGLHSAAAAEVLMLARASGLDAQTALEALTSSAGASKMLEVRGPVMVRHEYIPATGSIDIIVKDGGIIQDMARDAGCSLPLFDQAHRLYRSAQEDGLGSHDIAGIHDYYLQSLCLKGPRPPAE